MCLQVVDQKPDSLTILAPAKINLFLEVLCKRPDGFHEINSAFQAVSLYDKLAFELSDEPGIQISTTMNVDLPIDQNNLIYRAFEAVDQRFSLERGLQVILEKNIPISAGLGGGSADAAATIKAVNILFDMGLSDHQMAEIGLEVGSDVPFFFSNGQALVSGRGETVKMAEFPTDYQLVLVTPDLAVSTAKAYAGLKMDLTKPKNPFRLSRCSTVGNLVLELQLTGNDFEKIHFLSYPELGRIKNGLQDLGASLVRLSGSGPTIFGLFRVTPGLKIGEINGESGWQINSARPIVLTNKD